MKLVLFDGPEWGSLYPITLNRAVAEISLGMFTLGEKWINYLEKKACLFTQDYLSKEKIPTENKKKNLFINPAFLPEKKLLEKILALKENEILFYKNKAIAYYQYSFEKISSLEAKEKIFIDFPLIQIKYPWDLFLYNQKAIELDLSFLKDKKEFIDLSSTNTFINKENIFIEKGAKVNCSTLNASNGPIYIEEGAEIMEGSLIRGPLTLCKGAQIKMGTKIYGATTIGAFSKVGGEIQNSIIFPYSNKAHDGFLGNSVIGSWCNLGAGTNTSNLKNNYSKIKIWNQSQNKYQLTDLQFCGLIMGDHSKSAIGTNFNTGTLVGVCTNVFGKNNPPKHISSFRWGVGKKSQMYDFEKACQGIEAMMQRRENKLEEKKKQILKHIFDAQRDVNT